MGKPIRIDVGERKLGDWTLKSFIWEDAESGLLLGYNHHFQRMTKSGFVEFVRLDHHKKGEASEDAPHAHIRLEARETPNINDSVKTFNRLLLKIPEIQEVLT